jgi:hypothetical protein
MCGHQIWQVERETQVKTLYPVWQENPMKALGTMTAAAMILCLGACGDIEGGEPTAGVANLMAYSAVTGTVPFEVTADMPAGVKKVELLVAGFAEPVAVAKKKPYTLNWDTTNTPDGLYNTAVRVVANDGKAESSSVMPLVVLNHGVTADVFDYEENAGYVLEIPADYDGTQEVDAPHHWLNPAGVKTIIAVGGWLQPEGQAPWKIGVSIGKGVCPHRGVQYGDESYSDASPAVLTLNASDENASWTTFPETLDPNDSATQWYFVHLRPDYDNRELHLGQSVPYWLKIYLLQ